MMNRSENAAQQAITALEQLKRLEPFVTGLGKAILRELIAEAEQPAQQEPVAECWHKLIEFQTHTDSKGLPVWNDDVRFELPQAPPQQQAQPDRTGCTAGSDEECTNRRCATNCPALAQKAAEPARHSIEFLMRGEKMAFKIGAQQFTLDYEPSEPGEFDFMRNMLTSAISSITPDVKPSQPQTAEPAEQDLADLIAGELKVSRGTAYELMRKALEGQRKAEPVAWIRWEWNRTGRKSLVFEKPNEPSLAEEATGVIYDPLYTHAEPTQQPKRPQNCGTGYCSCIECVMEPATIPAAQIEAAQALINRDVDKQIGGVA